MPNTAEHLRSATQEDGARTPSNDSPRFVRCIRLFGASTSRHLWVLYGPADRPAPGRVLDHGLRQVAQTGATSDLRLGGGSHGPNRSHSGAPALNIARGDRRGSSEAGRVQVFAKDGDCLETLIAPWGLTAFARAGSGRRGH
jgi:hypothetical protein